MPSESASEWLARKIGKQSKERQMPSEIFVFGSNLKGIHGAGAAKYAAQNYGAQYGWFNGMTGNAYAIPTKNDPYNSLELSVIEGYVNQFIDYARDHFELKFKVTRIGCGLAGFKDEQIAPMFAKAPSNCIFDSVWLPYLLEVEWLRKYFIYGTDKEFFAMEEFNP
jgi:hypothetical protein